jgi:hypothetical protein
VITADFIAMLAASVLVGSLIGKVLADWVLAGRDRL